MDPLQADADALRDDAAVELNKKHCAFAGCAETFLSGRELSEHLQTDELHRRELTMVMDRMPPSKDEQSIRLFSAYCEAIAVKVRQGAPLDTYAIDRRAIYNYNKAAGDDQVYMPMCFSCARRFPYLGCLEDKDKNDISWYIGQMIISSYDHMVI